MGVLKGTHRSSGYLQCNRGSEIATFAMAGDGGGEEAYVEANRGTSFLFPRETRLHTCLLCPRPNGS